MSSVHNVKRVKRRTLGIVVGHRKYRSPSIQRYEVKCKVCERSFRSKYASRVYCSSKCRNKDYYQKHREEWLNYMKSYYWENKDKINEYKHLPRVVARRNELERERVKKWSLEKKLQKKEYNATYQKEHLDKFRIANHKSYTEHRQERLEHEKMKYAEEKLNRLLLPVFLNS